MTEGRQEPGPVMATDSEGKSECVPEKSVPSAVPETAHDRLHFELAGPPSPRSNQRAIRALAAIVETA